MGAPRSERLLAMLLPLSAAALCGLSSSPLCWVVILLSLGLAFLAPALTARLAPFALLAYGVCGVILAHVITRPGLPPAPAYAPKVIYGAVSVGPSDHAAYVLPQALAILAAGIVLLAVTGAPGGRAVRRAVAGLRGADGQPRQVPALLLLPVIALWEELLSQPLRFAAGPDRYGWVLAAGVLAAGVVLVAWLPRVAAAVTVLGTSVLGLVGIVLSLRMSLPAGTSSNRFMTVFYGAVSLHARFYPGFPTGASPGRSVIVGSVVIGGQDGALVLALTVVQAVALLVAGAVLGTRLPVVIDAPERADDSGPAAGRQGELADHTAELARRVTRLTKTRSDATSTAVAELRRIERDLHDGAQARLVALGMSLRAVQQLMPEHPEAALALVAEATETSSRALADLRGLVRGIYPPVLADRGLSDAVRALALDTPLAVAVDITLPGEPEMPVAAAAYFAIAEALTNAVRHADASTVDITVTGAAGMLRATVTDDGQGGADPAGGSGLAGVERRLATFDGVLALSSPLGGPTIVAIEIPCAAAGDPPAWAWDGGLADVVRSSWQTRTLI